ncbi:hypothetical protein K469DRAFT_689947 [Zopfia rhizophila CBS 207.26]|uniref:Uncharacterized protein n=1 Tax=Zopfia rhizophila CBS 207.26 TaxID=1314779 RepID=A0A6A6DUY9_9PEZI|nr:hypothetical protein K469DRAFT_689947 [Zopfia rhizophila CBS 207.26]
MSRSTIDAPSMNAPARFLHLNCDTIAADGVWDWPPHKWQHKAGSVFIVHKDKKSLLPNHVESSCRFCRFQVGAMFKRERGGFGDAYRIKLVRMMRSWGIW